MSTVFPRKKHPKRKVRKKVDENRIGQFRRDASDTSREAAFRIKPVSGPQRILVYKTLLAHPEGLTDQEIIEKTGMRQQSENPRRGELVKDGWVIPTAKRRLTESGCKAIVWKALKGGLPDES